MSSFQVSIMMTPSEELGHVLLLHLAPVLSSCTELLHLAPSLSSCTELLHVALTKSIFKPHACVEYVGDVCWMVLDLNDNVVVVVVVDTRRRVEVYDNLWVYFCSWEDVGLWLLQLAVSDILFRDVKRGRRKN